MRAHNRRTPLIIGAILLLAAVCYFPTRLSTPATLASDESIAATPPMGWNSWNRFGCDVSEQLIRQIADALASSGMRDAGYQYVVIDDCWQTGRDEQGAIVADPQRFPSGMAALGSYIHERGLKFGLYTDAGSQTCMGRPGSLGHEQQDAATYATWGVDYLKVDWCATDGLSAPTQFALFRDALAATGRPIVLSICTWGQQSPWDWGAGVGNLWRTTGDIADRWPSVLSIIRQNAVRAYAAGPGGWNDPDMLEVGNGRMNEREYRSHFGLWAMMAAPLIAGNDVRDMSDSTRAILLNREVIAIDQDARGTPALIIRDDGGPQVWSRPLAAANERAVALFNPTDAPATISVSWAELGLAPGAAQVRDLWAHADLGQQSDRVALTVAPHDTAMLKVIAPLLPSADTPPLAAAPGADAPAAEAPAAEAPAAEPLSYPSLSDLTPTFAISAFGPIEHDMSNGEDAAGDGHTLTLGDRSYARGLGVHAPSELTFDLAGACSVFAADVGIDAEVGAQGAAEFQVWADGQQIYTSGTLRGGEAAAPVYLNISGARELRLVVAPAGDSTDYAHADWADARLACSS